MQGKARSNRTDDLSFIFFKIRETRCSKTRRSWQRRARLALAKRDDITAAEKHEVCSVWARSNAQQIDSPAMSKLRGVDHRPQPHQTISAKSCTRRKFIERCNDARTSLYVENIPPVTVDCTLNHEAFEVFSPPDSLGDSVTYRPLRGIRKRQRRRRGHGLEKHPKKLQWRKKVSAYEISPVKSNEMSCKCMSLTRLINLKLTA